MLSALLLWLLPGCITPPKLGKDEGRAAVVWQHKNLAAPATPAASSDIAAERALEPRATKRSTSATSSALAGTLYNLAILRRQQGQFTEAERLYRRALDIRERKQGPNHPDVAVVLNNLAALEAAQGHDDAAQPLFERALHIRETALGNETTLTAESLNNLALLYAARDNAAAAEPLYRRAIAILEKQDTRPGSESGRPQLNRVLDNYAALLHDTGRDVEADELEARTALRFAEARLPYSPDPRPSRTRLPHARRSLLTCDVLSRASFQLRRCAREGTTDGAKRRGWMRFWASTPVNTDREHKSRTGPQEIRRLASAIAARIASAISGDSDDRSPCRGATRVHPSS